MRSNLSIPPLSPPDLPAHELLLLGREDTPSAMELMAGLFFGERDVAGLDVSTERNELLGGLRAGQYSSSR